MRDSDDERNRDNRRRDAGTLTIAMVDATWPEPPAPDDPQGHDFAHLVLLIDARTRTAELGAHAHRPSTPRERRTPPGARMPGGAINPQWFSLPVPETICWSLLGGMEGLLQPRANAVNLLLEQAAPIARRLVGNLVEVPGSGDLDWTPEAARAAFELRSLCDVGDTATVPQYGTLRAAMSALPGLVAEGVVAEASDEQLDALARKLAEITVHPHPKLLGPPIGRWQRRPWGGVVRLRADLYGLRANLTDDFARLDAERWFKRADRALAGRLSPEFDDAGVHEFAEQERRAARDAGFELAGVESALQRFRDDIRRS
jgi:hypothetical protein